MEVDVSNDQLEEIFANVAEVHVARNIETDFKIIFDNLKPYQANKF